MKKNLYLFLLGLMAEDMKENGRMENNMVKRNIFKVKTKCELVYGIMESDLSGFNKMKLDFLSFKIFIFVRMQSY